MLFRESDQIENPVGVRKKSRQLTANKRESAQEGTLAILKYLAEVIQAQGIAGPDKLFLAADPSFKGTVTVDELKAVIKSTIKDSGGINFKKLEKALNVRGNGYITRSQFVEMVENAQNSDADISEYQRIADSLKSASTAERAGSPSKVNPKSKDQK